MIEVTIVWGKDPDLQETKHYKFKTQAEYDAFFLGVNDMDGWEGYDITRDTTEDK
jgi:hypothetical protein